MSKDDVKNDLHFRLQLLLNLTLLDQYPFTKLVVEKCLTEKEYKETMELVEYLYNRYLEEIEEGFVHHEQLLIHFAGMLCLKLPVEETFLAMYQEGLYSELMGLFIYLTSGHK
ncbi:DUF1878 family protein [Halobacillus andaensis]|uniref:DUF1878 family protein n=1 Tax=Halobacillus andaensis TaxID=1176239 RepID=UPI003D73F936